MAPTFYENMVIGSYGDLPHCFNKAIPDTMLDEYHRCIAGK